MNTQREKDFGFITYRDGKVIGKFIAGSHHETAKEDLDHVENCIVKGEEAINLIKLIYQRVDTNTLPTEDLKKMLANFLNIKGNTNA